MLDFSSIQTVLFDMDGVLYRGQIILPGVHALLAFFAQQGIRYACITNNGSITPQQYEQKLAGMNIHIPATWILTSAQVTRHYLRATYPAGTTIYAIGMHGLHEVLFSDNYFVFQAHRPQVVVLGPDFTLTYEKLKLGCLAIRAGADFIVTNPDLTLPTEEGLTPDAGALSAALQAATAVTPLMMGKPQPALFQIALEQMAAMPETTLVIGDRLETDIAGAHHAGLRSALVLTGVSSRAEAETYPAPPEAIFEDLTQLLATWQSAVAAA